MYLLIINNNNRLAYGNDLKTEERNLTLSVFVSRGSKDSLPDSGLTFQQMINTLDKMYFSVTATTIVRESIDEIYNWLVAEIMKVKLQKDMLISGVVTVQLFTGSCDHNRFVFSHFCGRLMIVCVADLYNF